VDGGTGGRVGRVSDVVGWGAATLARQREEFGKHRGETDVGKIEELIKQGHEVEQFLRRNVLQARLDGEKGTYGTVAASLPLCLSLSLSVPHMQRGGRGQAEGHDRIQLEYRHADLEGVSLSARACCTTLRDTRHTRRPRSSPRVHLMRCR
jgi:hypothetical protein